MSFGRGAPRGRGGGFGGRGGGTKPCIALHALTLDHGHAANSIALCFRPWRIPAARHGTASPDSRYGFSLNTFVTAGLWELANAGRVEMGKFLHACEGEMVCESINPKIPQFNAQMFLENKVRSDSLFYPSIEFRSLNR